MIIRLDMASETPLYVQLRNAIVVGIGRGELQPGEGIPTVRQMAEDLGINAMTVNKCYAILKGEGFLEIDRRHGAKVSSRAALQRDFREKAEEELELLIAEATVRGLDKKEFLELCELVYGRMKSGNFQKKMGKESEALC